MLAEGVKAPGFDVLDEDGNRVSLDDFNGRWVLLWWYPKASTPG